MQAVRRVGRKKGKRTLLDLEEQFAWASARERKGTTPERRELRKARK